MSAPMKPTDKAYWMLLDDFTSTPTVYRAGCYICEDPEFAQMGLPLCFACDECGGHVPADDVECDDCGGVVMPLPEDMNTELAEELTGEARVVYEGRLDDLHERIIDTLQRIGKENLDTLEEL